MPWVPGSKGHRLAWDTGAGLHTAVQCQIITIFLLLVLTWHHTAAALTHQSLCPSVAAANGKYWTVADDGSIMADGSGKSAFCLQCRDNRTLTILARDNGCFIKGEQNGLFRAVGREIEPGVLWEY